MPIAFDTSQTFTVHLDSDADKPDDVRPVFVYRYLTAREWSKLCAFCDAREGLDGSVMEATDTALKHAATGLVGWKNIAVSFSADALGDVVNFREAMELAYKCANANTSGPEDKKKPESPA